jgi:hypothetical protein
LRQSVSRSSSGRRGPAGAIERTPAIGNSGYKNGKFYATAGGKGGCAPLKSKTTTVVTPDAEEPEGGF